MRCLRSSASAAVLVAVLCAAGSQAAMAQAPADLPVPDACRRPNGPPPCRDSDGDGLCDSWEIAKRLPGGEPLPDADPNRPDIYLQYDYMGWDEPGAPCVQDSDCANSGATPNFVCHEDHCNHNHKPDPRAFDLVVESFARQGIALHVDPNPHEVPHSLVVTFAKAGDPGNGPKAICAGADVQAGVLGGEAVSLFDIKDKYFDPARSLAYHYVVFGHHSTCLTDAGGALIGNCGQCPADRAIPRGFPTAGASGVAEIVGNDFIVSLAKTLFDPVSQVPRSPFIEAGVLMHELGHNLGLHHAGDVGAPELAPNYLSVMNNKYAFTGILESTSVGSGALKSCTTDAECSAGGHCRTSPITNIGRCVRIDYSHVKLNTLTESALVEADGVSPLSLGLTDIILFRNGHGAVARGPASGPIDWSGNGVIDPDPVAADLNLINGTTETMKGFIDWDHGSCRTSADCEVNAIRQELQYNFDPSIDPHAPCVQNRCRSLWYSFQCGPWSKD